jgi:DNA-binding transcriptional ArsR family regulator
MGGVTSFDISKVLELSKMYTMYVMATTARTPTKAVSPRTQPARSREKIHHPDTASLDLATVMRVVGDPIRLDMVRLLADGEPRVCSDIQEVVGLPTSTCSYHLKLLREAGFTRVRAAGTNRLITLRFDDLEERFPGLLAVLTA